MKRLIIQITSGSALALSLAIAAASAANPASVPSGGNAGGPTSAASSSSSSSIANTSGQVTVATDDSKEHTERKFNGQEVKGSDGKDLGNVHEFLVDPTSGKVEYAVISSGGIGGLGDKKRLVPLSALKRNGKDDEFNVALDRAAWDEIPPFSDDSLKADQVTITDSERRQIEGHFASGSSRATMSAGTSTYTAAMTGHLLKASDLRGKDVKSGSQEIGSIENVILDLETGHAHALFDGKSSFLGSSQKYLVPLNRFTMAGKREPVTTMLTRADFENGSNVSSLSTGALPVSSADTRNAGGTQLPDSPTPSTASTSTSAGVAGMANSSATGAPSASASTAPSPGTSTSDSALTPTGRDAASTANSTNPSSKSSTLAQTDPSSRNGTTATGAQKSDPSSGSANSPTPDQSTPPGNATSTDTLTQSDPSKKSGSSAAGTAPFASTSELASSSTPSRSTNAGGASQPSVNPNSPSSSASTAISDVSLSPTGKTSGDQNPSSNGALITAAQAVRKALDDDSTLARADVVVTPEEGKLVLRGKVTSEQKSAIESKAADAAAGQEIDSKLTVSGAQ